MKEQINRELRNVQDTRQRHKDIYQAAVASLESLVGGSIQSERYPYATTLFVKKNDGWHPLVEVFYNMDGVRIACGGSTEASPCYDIYTFKKLLVKYVVNRLAQLEIYSI